MPKQERRGKTANPELARAMRELRRSSAAAPHVPKPRKGTRREHRDRAVKDQEQQS